MKIYCEHKAFGREKVWCISHAGYLYMHSTFWGVVWQALSEWKNDHHIVG